MTNPSIHQSNLDIIAIQTKERERFEYATKRISSGAKQNLRSGQKVYLYSDPKYTGILIRPVEQTYPQLAHSFAPYGDAGSLAKWTVELDQGGYEAVNIDRITSMATPVSTEDNLEIPFSDSPESDHSLSTEIIALKQQIKQLRQENHRLTEELNEAKNTIRRAKDISPLIRPSFKRVLRLAHNACMEVQRTVGGWILKMGDKARKFRRLADIWDILSQDDWYLSDLFASDKLIPLDKIKPPRPRTRPKPPEKKAYPFFTPDEVIRRRDMGLPKCS